MGVSINRQQKLGHLPTEINTKMKTKFVASLTAVATGATALLGFSASAQAFSFGTSGISFEQDTTVDFTFFDSHGANLSTLNVYQLDSSNKPSLVQTLFKEIRSSDNPAKGDLTEWQGTFGGSVAGADAQYDKSGNLVNYGSKTQQVTFKANQTYTLGLVNFKDNAYRGTVFASSMLNLNSDPKHLQSTDGTHTQQTLFGPEDSLLKVLDLKRTTAVANPGQYTSGNPFAGNVLIAFDDRGNNNDRDFQDYILTARAAAPASVPEPASLAGVVLVAGAMAFSRRRPKQVG